MFGVFAFLILFGYRKEYCERTQAYRVRLHWITLLIVTVYGAITELLQYYVFIGRSGNKYDFFADVIGCILGIFIFKIIFRKKMIKN